MGERTEPPSGKRLAEARSRGQVARSVELNAAVAILVGFWLLGGPGAGLAGAIEDLLKQALSNMPTGELTGAWLINLAVQDLMQILPNLAIIIITLLVAGVTVTLIQTGPLWASKKIGVDLSRLNPLAGLQRFVSPQGLVELGRSLLKLLVVSWAAYSYLSGRALQLLDLGQTDIRSAVSLWGSLAYDLGLRVGGAYLILACADYLFQRWQLMRSLRMTKEELKEEARQQEGDPLIKSKVRERARRLARMRMMKKVPQAEVVITNPTHFAVALEYDRQHMHAPRVVAKGAALLAQRIREIAQAHDVPIVENPPVARALYSTVEVEQEVPPELYIAVAEVFAFVYNLKARRRAAYAPPSRAPSPAPAALNSEAPPAPLPQ